jgi:hypothetical protein
MPDDKYTELQNYFDNRYVLKDTCKSTHDSLNSNVTDIKLEQERISTKLEFSSKIEIAILLAVVTSVVAAVMSLILK